MPGTSSITFILLVCGSFLRRSLSGGSAHKGPKHIPWFGARPLFGNAAPIHRKRPSVAPLCCFLASALPFLSFFSDGEGLLAVPAQWHPPIKEEAKLRQQGRQKAAQGCTAPTDSVILARQPTAVNRGQTPMDFRSLQKSPRVPYPSTKLTVRQPGSVLRQELIT